MIWRIKPRLSALALMLASAATPALSQDASWFAGLGIGQVKIDGCPGAAAPGATCDDKDTTWKIFGGYQFNSYLGYEIGLVDLSEWPASLGAVGTANAKLRIFELTLVGTMPLSQRFSVYGKAGVYQWDADFEPAAGVAATADANGNDYTFGLGATYKLTRTAAVRLEWQRYNKVGDPSTTGRFNVDVVGVGALLSF